ncbi:thymidine kinase, cytosolic isoform X1 [Macaca nemestrina]|uniref:thymidine kinase, cytosolic n=1 Tax=Macaca mulatta TaxID=9544 RepID=UPI0003ABC437|nr:thymidine kinase, cytosolic [Macaca mulatta]
MHPRILHQLWGHGPLKTRKLQLWQGSPSFRPAAFPDIVEFCEAMANAGKTVIVAALDGTFQRKPFGTILNLVPLAESVVKLTAVCMECFREAAYTKRLGTEKEVEVIGGADKYHSVCRLCYFKKASGQPAGPDNKENCPVPGKPGEAVAARKLFAPQQILQCSPAN